MSERSPRSLHERLSRRESQIMNVLYRLEEATAEEVRQQLPDPPTNATVRSVLRILEEKGHLTHHKEGRRYVYAPTVPPEKAKRSALKHLTETFFGDSAPDAAAALISMSRSELSDEDLDHLARLIDEARSEGR